MSRSISVETARSFQTTAHSCHDGVAAHGSFGQHIWIFSAVVQDGIALSSRGRVPTALHGGPVQVRLAVGNSLVRVEVVCPVHLGLAHLARG
jgi:hypothetical protein